MNPNPSRRLFIGKVTAATAGLTFLRNVHAQPGGSNSDVRFGIVGTRGKGNGHMGQLLKMNGARVQALCDVDTDVLKARSGIVKEKQGVVTAYTDYRQLCADKDVDAVVIATPNHLHTLIALTAIANGKNVYVEKPVSHNHRESLALVAAAEKRPELIIQHGMQRRSDTGWIEIMDYLKSGELGKVKYSRGFCYKPRKSIGLVTEPVPVPDSIDYNLWSGPREMLPVMRRSFHYDWHWQFPYGNGDIGNQGPHQMDVARWALGEEKVSNHVLSVGGRFGYDDNGHSANTQIAFFDYEIPLIFEVRGLPNSRMDWGKGMSNYKGIRIGNVIECEGGHIAEAKVYDENGKWNGKKFGVTDGAGHMENFIEQIRSGKKLENCLVKQGSASASLCHMANLSYQLGKETPKGEVRDALKVDSGIQESYDRFCEHLDANGVDLKVTQPTLGPWLEIDPETEMYKGAFADKANEIGQGAYRKEFELPAV